MKFRIPLLGKTREKYLAAGIDDYATRLRRFKAVEMPVLKERHSRKDVDEVVKAHDAQRLLEQVGSGDFVVALDPQGQHPDSEQLALLLQGWEDRGVSVACCLIGGHLGLHPLVLERADIILSLSRLTFTHEMTRFFLLEQLYRACTINAGHNYHK